MRDGRFASLAERLLRGGVAPRHVRRTIFELKCHSDDLVGELMDAGGLKEEIEARASARLGTEDGLVESILARSELRSWAASWPWLAENTAPIAIDWAKEAERAAAHRIEADEEADRRASALSPRRGPRVGASEAPAAAPQFGWDHAHTHRLELSPDGGMVVNLNDRCAIVVKFPFFLPGCKIGKMESRGDLFTHMNDPPTLGDWKDH